MYVTAEEPTCCILGPVPEGRFNSPRQLKIDSCQKVRSTEYRTGTRAPDLLALFAQRSKFSIYLLSFQSKAGTRPSSSSFFWASSRLLHVSLPKNETKSFPMAPLPKSYYYQMENHPLPAYCSDLNTSHVMDTACARRHVQPKPGHIELACHHAFINFGIYIATSWFSLIGGSGNILRAMAACTCTSLRHRMAGNPFKQGGRPSCIRTSTHMHSL
ncbi:hypothetical protein V8C37DRAFT_59345 [Trichoderma ceciliae]